MAPRRKQVAVEVKEEEEEESLECRVREVVNLADRVELESALVKLVTGGLISFESLLDVGGLKYQAVRRRCRLKPGEAFANAKLTVSGSTGEFERLGAVEIELILRCVGTRDRLASSETCRGLLSLRGSCRIWRDFDLSDACPLQRPTVGAVKKIFRLLDFSNLETLVLAPHGGNKDPLSSSDYVNLCNTLAKEKNRCPNLRYLALRAKRFGDSDKPLLATLPLMSNLRGLEILDVRENRLDALLKLTSNAPHLECLKIDSYQIPWQILLTRLSAQAKLQRGHGARSVLRRFHCLNGWSASNVGFMAVSWILHHFAEHFPDIVRLSLTTVAEMPFFMGGTQEPQLKYLRYLRLRHAHFYDTRRLRAEASDALASDEALVRYFSRIEHACPVLEHWETARDDPYMSRTDYNLGKRVPPPPTLHPGSLAGSIFPKLKVLTLGGITITPQSFDGLQAPNLTTFIFWASKSSPIPNHAKLAEDIKTNFLPHAIDVTFDGSLKYGSYFAKADHGWLP